MIRKDSRRVLLDTIPSRGPFTPDFRCDSPRSCSPRDLELSLEESSPHGARKVLPVKDGADQLYSMRYSGAGCRAERCVTGSPKRMTSFWFSVFGTPFFKRSPLTVVPCREPSSKIWTCCRTSQLTLSSEREGSADLIETDVDFGMLP